MALSFRSRVEHASYPLVERLGAVPKPVGLTVLVAALAVGILAPRPWGGLAFLALAAVLAWFLYLTWQRLTMPERLLRCAALTLVAAVAVVRIVPS